MVKLMAVVLWFCGNQACRRGKLCVTSELLQYPGTLLKSGESIVVFQVSWKNEYNCVLNNDLWDIAYLTGFRETKSIDWYYKVWQKFCTSGNIIWSVLRGLRPKGTCSKYEVRDLNETIEYRNGCIQYIVLNNNLKKIFGGGILEEGIFSLALRQFCFGGGVCVWFAVFPVSLGEGWYSYSWCCCQISSEVALFWCFSYDCSSCLTPALVLHLGSWAGTDRFYCVGS